MAACGAPKGGAGSGTTRISIATGGVAGVYYVYGGAYAAAIGRSLPGYVATAEVTAASVDNLRLVGAKKSAIAFTLMDTAGDAVAGRAPFDAPVPVQGPGADLHHLCAGGGARSGDPLRRRPEGQASVAGRPGSGAEIVALRILKAAGIDPDKDIKRRPDRHRRGGVRPR